MAEAVVRERLLRRVEGRCSQVRDLYLPYLKQEAHEVYCLIVSFLRSLGSGDGQVFQGQKEWHRSSRPGGGTDHKNCRYELDIPLFKIKVQSTSLKADYFSNS